MALAFHRERRSTKGPLAGIRPVYFEAFSYDEPAESVLSKVVAGVVAGMLLPLPSKATRIESSTPSAAYDTRGGTLPTPGRQPEGNRGITLDSETRQTLAGNYKARSLEGIWATAPFLHNGSVPSLYELLLPAEDRTRIFPVGSGAFDPVTVGVDLEVTQQSDFLDTTIPGNSNSGPEFATDLSEASRMSLIEFLKTL